ncbi:MAG: thioredoxin family protein [Verrucomicrobia bacterium]|jgi:thiol-disulfide isomerase/thioredoxin|nr:thioredoxin family protein [Verrucomicrobiota bacterium]
MNRRLFARSFLLAVTLALPAIGLAADPKTKSPKPLRVAFGQEINLADYLVPGKTTVFDFTSKYCPPCVAIAPDLEKLHAKRDDIVVVFVDINRPETKGIDWKSPVAQQHGMRSIPHFKIFGPDGKLVAEDAPKDAKARQMVTKWFK